MERKSKRTRKNERHGKSQSAMYARWSVMIDRCHNPSNASYPFYGAKGVKVCLKWRRSFVAYLADVGYAPFKGAHLSRIVPTGDYRPGNVRWLTQSENLKSSRDVAHVKTHAGEKTLPDAAIMVGKTPEAVRQRVKAGTAPSKALLMDKSVRKGIVLKYGVPEFSLKTITTVARENGVGYQTLRMRLLSGMKLKEAIADIRSKDWGGVKRDALANGVDPKLANVRMHKGWPRDIAVSAPKFFRYKEAA